MSLITICINIASRVNVPRTRCTVQKKWLCLREQFMNDHDPFMKQYYFASSFPTALKGSIKAVIIYS